MRGEVFHAWAEQMLTPTPSTGDVVIMDNLSAHRVTRVREAIEAKGAKLKSLGRKAAARTVDALWTAIGHSLSAFSPTECADYFSAAGYESE
jgi:transposase